MIERLFAYVAGALDEDAERALEDALAADADLARAAERVVALVDAIRGAAGDPGFVPVVLARDLEALRATGVTVAAHRPVEGRIAASMGREPFVAAHIPVVARQGEALDVELCTPDGVPYFRAREVAFDPEAGEIVVLCHREVALAAGVLRIRVLGRDHSIRAEVAIENHAAEQ